LASQGILDRVKRLVVYLDDMGSRIEGAAAILASEDSDIKTSNEELLKNCGTDVSTGLGGC
jgi:hypothetical protein